MVVLGVNHNRDQCWTSQLSPDNFWAMSHHTLKTVLVTGATAGIGLECARALLATCKYRVLLGARDTAKGNRIRAALADPTRAEVVALDLASLESVKRAADGLAAGPQLFALVCNAGVHEAGPPTFTQDGFETMFGVNHLAHQLLVLRTLSHLTNDARIVVVSSGTHDPDTLEGRHNPPGATVAAALAQGKEATSVLSSVRRYSSSKLCNLLFVRELDRRLRAAGSQVTINGFDPGAVPGTELTRGWSPAMRLMVKSSWLLRAFGMAVSTPARAGGALARLVSDDTLLGQSGLYFQLDRKRLPSKTARDAELAKRLYEDSLQLLGEQSPV
jgi:NAD(P)-dependent dehydrogenase (short-subunit alcohol dehydrogenase family)